MGSCISGNERPNFFNGQLSDYYCLKKATSWSYLFMHFSSDWEKSVPKGNSVYFASDMLLVLFNIVKYSKGKIWWSLSVCKFDYVRNGKYLLLGSSTQTWTEEQTFHSRVKYLKLLFSPPVRKKKKSTEASQFICDSGVLPFGKCCLSHIMKFASV